MPEKSIILHAHEIRRLLDVGEAQIWRPIKPQPYYEPGAIGELQRRNGVITHVCGAVSMEELAKRCPHQPGERRWVREKYAYLPNEYEWIASTSRPAREGGLWYAADGGIAGAPWRSPVSMPREFSRLTVEILDVEARQVQSITEGEARTTGVLILSPPRGNCGRPESYRRAFIRDWDTRYPPRGPCFEENPCAWKLEVKKL